MQFGGQDHLSAHLESLSDAERQQFKQALSKVDLARASQIFTTATKEAPKKGNVEPLPQIDSLIGGNVNEKRWRDIGLTAISKGQVAVLLLAGGQGTRLGSSAPKGCYDIGLPSHKSLFQLQAERILALQKLAAVHAQLNHEPEIRWLVMTSAPTHQHTVDFFTQHGFFGLKSEQVVFFQQGVLPAFSFDGKVLLDSKTSISCAPDGNGGLYAALHSQHILEDLEKRGIPFVHAYCVDNCLVKVADPIFLGYSIEKQLECGAKVVRKLVPQEPVGVICRRDKKYAVVEYSEIDQRMTELRNPDGSLVYRAANIANHFYTVSFLKRIHSFESELQYHIAKKKIPYLDTATGQVVKPERPNGIKLELFIFDVFPFTEKFGVLETDRLEEFAPLKNASGCPEGDSPETSRAAILNQHTRFLKSAGAIVADGAVVELSPLVTYAGENLEFLRGKTVSSGIFESKNDFE